MPRKSNGPAGGNGRYDEQIAVRIPAATLTELRALARRNDRTLAQELRRAVKRHLEAEAA
jgi:hypothetical protein